MIPRRGDPKSWLNSTGPGSYNQGNDVNLKKAPAWSITMAQQRPSSTADQVPSVGAYNLQKGISGPKWGFGTAARSKVQTEGRSIPLYKIPDAFNVVPYYNMPKSAAPVQQDAWPITQF